MNFLANKSIEFAADRFEEWMGGQCLSHGPSNAIIKLTATNNSIDAVIEGADSLSISKTASFSPISDSGVSVDLGDRLQYLNPYFAQGDPLEPILCHVFYRGRTISYLRFAMSSPDRIIEFYGKTVTFDGMPRIEYTPGQRIPSFKRAFIDDIADQYRLLLKENTETLAIVDHQFACVAFSLNKLFTLTAMAEDEHGELKEQVFKDASSIISQYYPIFGNEALDIARNWYNQFIVNPNHVESFLHYYYEHLQAGESIDGYKIQQVFLLR